VYIFERDNNDDWTQKIKLVASDGAVGNHFGYSVSISNNYAIVGAYADEEKGSNSGSAYIFNYANNSRFNINDLTVNGSVGIGTTTPGAPLHLSYTNGLYNNVQGFINEATSGRSTTRLRSTTDNPSELIFDVNNAIRWDFSCKKWENNYDFYIYKAGTNPTLTSLGSGAYPVMVLTQTGRVGIGTTSPTAPLHVNGSTSGTSGSGYYISSDASYLRADYDWSDKNLSIYASHSIFAAVFSGASDERIKENITEIDDSYSLKKVRDINCVWYNYKDKVFKGNVRVAGFIAQQVREHLPEAVSLIRNFLPNELRSIENPQWSTVTDNSGNVTFKLTISDLEDVSGNTKYRFYVSNDPSGNNEVNKDVTTLEDDPKSFIFDEEWSKVFLYGKEVDDFHTLDKQKLFALNFSATQEIDRIQQAQVVDISLNKVEIDILKKENQSLKNEITQLKSQMSDLLTRITALEN
jgi:hypothetical protein